MLFKIKKIKISILVIAIILISNSLFTLQSVKTESKVNSISFEKPKETDFNIHLNANYSISTDERIILEHIGLSSIYDTSMMNFHDVYSCHNESMGEDITVMVIDTPVDYRHKIFNQESYNSLVDENCYRITFDYTDGSINGFYNSPNYIGDFPSNFDLSTNYFVPFIVSHGTLVAGLIKQIAPKADIISMGVEASYPDLNIKGHIKSLHWALNYLENPMNNIDIISISSHGDVANNSANLELYSLVRDLKENHDVMFTFSTDNENIDLNTTINYGSMGNETRVMGIGGVYDTDNLGSLTGYRISGGYNSNNQMDLEIMAAGYNITSAYYCNETNGQLEHFVSYNEVGTSFATPIVAGSIALAKAKGLNIDDIETWLKGLAIPAKIYDQAGSDAYYWQYYGEGILNIAGLLGVQDYDNDGLNDDEEYFTHGTDPFEADEDQDGLNDWEEINSGVDGYVTDPHIADIDNDGLTDGEEYNAGTNPFDNDTDDDDLDDGWEVDSQQAANPDHRYNPLNNNTDGQGPLDGWEDPDNDGLINLEEEVYGTDYLNDDTDGDNLLDGYEIHFCATDPLLIDTDGDNLYDDWEWVYGLDPTSPNANSDPDSDGLTNYQEYQAGTNPVLADTDSDGMPDGWELTNNFNPLVNDANLDPDTDGATNLEEYSHGTDPHDDDTDQDGMEDGWEIDYSLDPLHDDGMNDADGDGLYNIDEYVNDCDPTDTDTDNDGLNDKQEILNQCNPNDTDSDNDGWSDGFEVYTSGTEPDDADTDNDGLTDKNEFNYWKYTRGRTTSQAYAYIKDTDVDNDNANDGTELAWGTDPLDNDSDGDGLYDGSEDLYYDTDPTDYDSDNDGYSDGEEVAAGTDPNDPNDHPGSGGGGGFGW